MILKLQEVPSMLSLYYHNKFYSLVGGRNFSYGNLLKTLPKIVFNNDELSQRKTSVSSIKFLKHWKWWKENNLLISRNHDHSHDFEIQRSEIGLDYFGTKFQMF